MRRRCLPRRGLPWGRLCALAFVLNWMEGFREGSSGSPSAMDSCSGLTVRRGVSAGFAGEAVRAGGVGEMRLMLMCESRGTRHWGRRMQKQAEQRPGNPCEQSCAPTSEESRLLRCSLLRAWRGVV